MQLVEAKTGHHVGSPLKQYPFWTLLCKALTASGLLITDFRTHSFVIGSVQLSRSENANGDLRLIIYLFIDQNGQLQVCVHLSGCCL